MTASVLVRAERKVADTLLPWAAANATVWPSTHAQHRHLLAEVARLHEVVRLCLVALEWEAADPERDPAAFFEEMKAREDATTAARAIVGDARA